MIKRSAGTRVLTAGLRLSVAASAGALRLADAQVLQPPDTVYDVRITKPAYVTGAGPVIAIDAAHNNFHTADNRYKPFAELLRSDGYKVRANLAPFSAAALKDVAVLVVANALGSLDPLAAQPAAFTASEENELRNWVMTGGSLLLIADHEPMGAASKRLAKTFGVDMSTGRTFDDPHSDWSSGSASWLVFLADTGARLADHAITRGRDESERIRRVVTFTGQSLKGPAGSVALLPLANGAFDMMGPDQRVSAEGRSQALAFTLGKGRVVVFGEGALFTAQIASAPGQPNRRYGFTWPNNDDRQLALNTVHWLSGILR